MVKKIMVILPSYDTGGAQQFALNLSKYLVSKDIEVIIVGLRKSKNSSIIINRFGELDVKLYDFKKKKVFFSFFEIRKLINEKKPDVVLSTVHNVDFLISLVKLFGCRFKLIIRKASFPYDKGFKERIIHFDKLQNYLSDKIIVLTEEMRDHYSNHRNKIDVINNMIDANNVRLLSTQKIDNHIMENNNMFHIISVGRLVYEKGYDNLLDAFEILKEKYSFLKLTIIGEGPLKSNLMNQIESKGIKDITILPFQSNPYKYMNKANLYILSSRFEGFPNIILEAFASRVPVVATKCRTGPAEIITDGVNGFLVNEDSSRDIALKIEYVLKNPELIASVIENAEKSLVKYTLDSIGDKYISIFNQVKGGFCNEYNKNKD